MAPGSEFELSGYSFRFEGVENSDGPNYRATKGSFDVFKEDHLVAHLHPEKRIYLVQQSPMTEAAIDAGFTRDLFIALGEPLDDQGTWAVRIYFKPYIRWIWLGALLMGIGGMVAALDQRYLSRRFRRESQQAEQVA